MMWHSNKVLASAVERETETESFMGDSAPRQSNLQDTTCRSPGYIQIQTLAK